MDVAGEVLIHTLAISTGKQHLRGGADWMDLFAFCTWHQHGIAWIEYFTEVAIVVLCIYLFGGLFQLYGLFMLFGLFANAFDFFDFF